MASNPEAASSASRGRGVEVEMVGGGDGRVEEELLRDGRQLCIGVIAGGAERPLVERLPVLVGEAGEVVGGDGDVEGGFLVAGGVVHYRLALLGEEEAAAGGDAH